MIKYALRCDQNHEFEGWFRNNEDCEQQTKSDQLLCPLCGSTHISKSLMAPSVSGTRSQDSEIPLAGQSSEQQHPVALGGSTPDQSKMQEMLRALREHVVENSDYVGDKFAEEARKMHFEETEKRGIYGEATTDEVKELVDEGIDCLPLPRLPEEQN